ncbi:beta-galactosidase [Kineococcus gynurae]|uniref:Beta-galactosidase n=1 Tax=Kineococcus gynurae TaxID=452979 RepID=A0ABV5LXL5_9ACTN
MVPSPPPVTVPGSAPGGPTDLGPDLVLAGEIPYFRLNPDEWVDRLDGAVTAGLTTVATYVPWLWHEVRGTGSRRVVDLSGRTHPARDLGRFLDLCAERGLGVIARPGPFVMAELKNEGLPYSLGAAADDLRPPGWDGRRPTETIVDYGHPRFLTAVRGWFAAVLPLLTTPRPGPGPGVVAVQLDNEIGMLPWVANSPDLSERTVARVVRDLVDDLGPERVRAESGLGPDDLPAWTDLVRRPPEHLVLRIQRAVARDHRRTYAAYVAALADLAREFGVTVPLLVNVHGCWAERAERFPIGISQLRDTWRDPRILPGTDFYLGDPDPDKLPALWAANAFLAATLSPGQATGCLEFEVSRGSDYGEALQIVSGPEAAPLKAQLFVAQGNTFLNVYLWAGGRNPVLDADLVDTPPADGNDRIATTGERHGFSAPVDPEGRTSPDHPALVAALGSLRGNSALLRAARPVSDGVTLGFVPDHFATEFCAPHSPLAARVAEDLDRFRGCGPRSILVRSLLFSGFAPDAVDLGAPVLELDRARVLALAPTPYLDADLQERLVAWVRSGGRLLLHGPFPTHDLLGRPVDVLSEALGLDVGERQESGPTRFCSVRPSPGLALPGPDRAEVRAGFVQPLRGVPDEHVLARIVGDGTPCAVERPLDRGRVVVVAADLPCRLGLWRAFLDRLGARPRFELDSDVPGVVLVPTATPDGTRITHVLNVSPWPARVLVSHEGAPLHPRFTLPARHGAWLVQEAGGTRAELVRVGVDPEEEGPR